MIKAIIFDLFGVIRPDNLTAAYAKFGGDMQKDIEFIRETHYASHIGLRPSAPAFAEHLGITEEEWRDAVETGDYDHQLVEYIQELRKHYKVGVLSNIGKDGFQRYFTDEELSSFFDTAVASGDIGYAKPEAQAYEIMADRLGVRLDECVFTDDREEYCLGAQGVGMTAIQYKSLPQFKAALAKILQRQ